MPTDRTPVHAKAVELQAALANYSETLADAALDTYGHEPWFGWAKIHVESAWRAMGLAVDALI